MPAKKKRSKPLTDDSPRVAHVSGHTVSSPNILEQVEEGMPFDMIAEQWRGSVPVEGIKEAIRLAREAFLEHASEYSPMKKAG
jgi:uncharacterized protein (DUF433 family)